MKFKVSSLKRKAEPDCAENSKTEKLKVLKKAIISSDLSSEDEKPTQKPKSAKKEATVPVKSFKKETSSDLLSEEEKTPPKVVKTPVKTKKQLTSTESSPKDEKPVPKVIQTIAKPDKKDSIRNSTPKEDKPVSKSATKTMSLALALSQTQVVENKKEKAAVKVLSKPTSVKFVPAKGTNSITKLNQSSESESEEKLSPELSLIFEDLKRKINDKLEEPPKPKVKKVENEKESNAVVNKPKKHKTKKIKNVNQFFDFYFLTII